MTLKIKPIFKLSQIIQKPNMFKFKNIVIIYTDVAMIYLHCSVAGFITAQTY